MTATGTMLLRVAGAGSIHEQHAPDAHHHCQGGQYLLLVRFPSPVMVQQRPVVRFYGKPGARRHDRSVVVFQSLASGSTGLGEGAFSRHGGPCKR